MFRRRRPRPQDVAAPPSDGRLRFVLFRPVGPNFTIDAIVDSEGSGRLGAQGTAVTLRLHRPAMAKQDLEIESMLRRWADEDRVVDVTLGDGTTITALQADGGTMRLQLVG
ncbi:MAG TPA: hypothetical protein VM345_05185 [Acidimicrobiales bacterium]|jgi:hypothetical protein|nr:hypothetical protein [Acidimicrobiales bacterium]